MQIDCRAKHDIDVLRLAFACEYFANPFGPEQMKDIHEPLARKYFERAFELGVKVGQVRTRLGIEGWEREGPRAAAEALFKVILEG